MACTQTIRGGSVPHDGHHHNSLGTLNPFGQIPTYEEGSLALFESGRSCSRSAGGVRGCCRTTPPRVRGRSPGCSPRSARSSRRSSSSPTHDCWESDKPWADERRPLVEARVRDRLKQLSARLGSAAWLDGAFSAGDLMMVSVLLRLSGRRCRDRGETYRGAFSLGHARVSHPITRAQLLFQAFDELAIPSVVDVGAGSQNEQHLHGGHVPVTDRAGAARPRPGRRPLSRRAVASAQAGASHAPCPARRWCPTTDRPPWPSRASGPRRGWRAGRGPEGRERRSTLRDPDSGTASLERSFSFPPHAHASAANAARATDARNQKPIGSGVMPVRFRGGRTVNLAWGSCGQAVSSCWRRWASWPARASGCASATTAAEVVARAPPGPARASGQPVQGSGEPVRGPPPGARRLPLAAGGAPLAEVRQVPAPPRAPAVRAAAGCRSARAPRPSPAPWSRR
jgi:hypothetical protein